MNHYVNLCPAYTEKTETLTVDLPPEHMDEFMQMVHILAEEKMSPPAVPLLTW